MTVVPVVADSAKQPEGLKVGSRAPNIFGRKMDDSPFSLSKDATGAKVINFFWVKCLPCKKELPELAELEKKYPKVRFVSVHADAAYTKELPDYLSDIGRHPSIIVVADKIIMDRYAFKAFPHTVVVDKDNKVLMTMSGFNEANMEKLEDFIKQLE